jgi:hypothetical protein
MKHKYTIILFLFSIIVYSQSDFRKGWKDGFKAGYCQSQPNCYPPMAPEPPTHYYSATYEEGYDLGRDRGKLERKAKDEGGGSSGSSSSNSTSSGGSDNSAAAAGAAIYIMRINNNKKKLEENSLMYEIEPSVETAFEIAKSAKMLFNAGAYENRFGPISKEHKLLIVKYKGNYKKYLKSLK